MSWIEIFAGITGLMAVASFVLSGLAYRRSGVQDLPPISVVWSWSSTGYRGISFDLERLPGRPHWVVHSATVSRNWRRRPWLAGGQERGISVLDNGEEVIQYGPDSPWRHRVVFDHPRKEGAVMIHPEAPDCQVTLKITLTTSPSPTVARHIVSKRVPRYG